MFRDYFEINVHHKFIKNIDLPLKVSKVKQDLVKQDFYFKDVKLLNFLPVRIREIKFTKIRKISSCSNLNFRFCACFEQGVP